MLGIHLYPAAIKVSWARPHCVYVSSQFQSDLVLPKPACAQPSLCAQVAHLCSSLHQRLAAANCHDPFLRRLRLCRNCRQLPSLHSRRAHFEVDPQCWTENQPSLLGEVTKLVLVMMKHVPVEDCRPWRCLANHL